MDVRRKLWYAALAGFFAWVLFLMGLAWYSAHEPAAGARARPAPGASR